MKKIHGDHFTLLFIFNDFGDYSSSIANDGEAKNKLKNYCKRKSINYRAMVQAEKIRKQLVEILAKNDITSNVIEKTVMQRYNRKDSFGDIMDVGNKIGKALVEGYCTQVAMKIGRNLYTTAFGTTVEIDISSGQVNGNVEWVIYHLLETKSGKNYIKMVTQIDPKWITETGNSQVYRYYNDISRHLRFIGKHVKLLKKEETTSSQNDPYDPLDPIDI